MYDGYNTIENHIWIPRQAFLSFPIGDTKKRQQDDFKLINDKNQIKRLLYEGGIQYLQEQIQLIDEFKRFLRKKQVKLGKQWSNAYIYKFLQSTGYDYKRSMKQILAHDQYKKQLLSKDFDDLRRRVEPSLKQGVIYLNGRDCKFRPIIVVDIGKINGLGLKEEELNQCLQYFFEFLYRNMFICGQVQNVVGIIDVQGTSPLSLLKPMKMAINFLQGNYKYKLHEIYIIQTTSLFQMAYNIARQFMKQDTIRKIKVVQEGQVIPRLLQYANPSQLEQKFGGTHPNLKNGECWPPKQFSDSYLHPNVPSKIISDQQYRNMYKEGLLPGRKIYLGYVIEAHDSQDQIPMINNRPPSSKLIRTSQSINQEEKQSYIQRALDKLTCLGCFGGKPHSKTRKSKKKIKG